MSSSSLAQRAIAMEAGIWRSLYIVLMRRPRVPRPEALAFGYAAAAATIIWIFIGVSAVEVVVFHLVVPWEIVRIVGLVIGVWGLLWMLGLLASLYAHPHAVDVDGVRVRYGTSVNVLVPWDSIDTIQMRRRDLPNSRSVQVDGSVVNVGVSSQVNVRMTMSEPTELALPKGRHVVSELNFYTEDPKALIAGARDILSRL